MFIYKILVMYGRLYTNIESQIFDIFLIIIDIPMPFLQLTKF